MRWLSIILAIVCGLLIWNYFGGRSLADMRSIFATFSAVAGTLLGFVIAALAILTAVVERPLIANLRKTGHYDILLSELYLTAAGYLSVLVISLAGLFFPDDWVLSGVSLSVALMVLATGLFVSSGHKFSLVMKFLK